MQRRFSTEIRWSIRTLFQQNILRQRTINQVVCVCVLFWLISGQCSLAQMCKMEESQSAEIDSVIRRFEATRELVSQTLVKQTLEGEMSISLARAGSWDHLNSFLNRLPEKRSFELAVSAANELLYDGRTEDALRLLKGRWLTLSDEFKNLKGAAELSSILPGSVKAEMYREANLSADSLTLLAQGIVNDQILASVDGGLGDLRFIYLMKRLIEADQLELIAAIPFFKEFPGKHDAALATVALSFASTGNVEAAEKVRSHIRDPFYKACCESMCLYVAPELAIQELLNRDIRLEQFKRPISSEITWDELQDLEIEMQRGSPIVANQLQLLPNRFGTLDYHDHRLFVLSPEGQDVRKRIYASQIAGLQKMPAVSLEILKPLCDLFRQASIQWIANAVSLSQLTTDSPEASTEDPLLQCAILIGLVQNAPPKLHREWSNEYDAIIPVDTASRSRELHEAGANSNRIPALFICRRNFQVAPIQDAFEACNVKLFESHPYENQLFLVGQMTETSHGEWIRWGLKRRGDDQMQCVALSRLTHDSPLIAEFSDDIDRLLNSTNKNVCYFALRQILRLGITNKTEKIRPLIRNTDVDIRFLAAQAVHVSPNLLCWHAEDVLCHSSNTRLLAEAAEVILQLSTEDSQFTPNRIQLLENGPQFALLRAIQNRISAGDNWETYRPTIERIAATPSSEWIRRFSMAILEKNRHANV